MQAISKSCTQGNYVLWKWVEFTDQAPMVKKFWISSLPLKWGYKPLQSETFTMITRQNVLGWNILPIHKGQTYEKVKIALYQQISVRDKG